MLHPFIKLSFILGGLGTFLILLGMAIPAWMKDSSRDLSVGLYLLCGPGGCASLNLEAGGVYASRAFIMIAFFCAIGGIVDGAIYYCKYFAKSIENKKLPLVSSILYFVAAGVCLLGSIIYATAGLQEVTIVFGRNFDFAVSYSLGLTIVGALGSAGAGVLTVIHLNTERGRLGTAINPS